MQSDVFWKSAVLTAVVLIVGIQLGIWFDSFRVEELRSMLTQTELDFSDARLQAEYFQSVTESSREFCDAAIRANLEFNEKIYQQGVQLEKYETINRFAPDIMRQKQRYALLQFQFWLNALSIRKACAANYSTILYLYRFDTSNASELELPQKLQSATLLDLKERCGQNVMLSPIPVDMNLTSVSAMVMHYGITETPALIINTDTVIQGLADPEELAKYVKC